MNVLMMFPYAPQPPPNDLGGMKRNIPFFAQAAKRHAVTVLAYGSPEEEKVFRGAYGARCAAVRFVDRRRPRVINGIEALWLLLTWRSNYRQVYRTSMQKALDGLCAHTRFDVIHTCTQMFGYFRFPEGVPVVTDTHEVEYDLAQRTYRKTKNLFWKFFTYLSYRVGRREEIENCAKFDALIATTERDAEIFRRDVPTQRVVVIQNGVDPSFYDAPGVPRERGALVFTGMMSFYPNAHGITWFIDEVFPLVLEAVPGARLYVVGKDPPREVVERASDRVTVTGFVDDVRPYMARGEIFIIPLHIGGGDPREGPRGDGDESADRHDDDRLRRNSPERRRLLAVRGHAGGIRGSRHEAPRGRESPGTHLRKRAFHRAHALRLGCERGSP